MHNSTHQAIGNTGAAAPLCHMGWSAHVYTGAHQNWLEKHLVVIDCQVFCALMQFIDALM
jgi:hypothetical protein